MITEKIARTGMAGIFAISALGAGFAAGAFARDQVESALEAFACHISPVGCNVHTRPESGSETFGKFQKLGEKLVGTYSILTFGTAEEEVEGTGKLDVRYSLVKEILNGHPVAGTIFLEPKPATFSYEPCIVAESNYTKTGLLASRGNPNTEDTGQLEVTATRSATGKEHVLIKAGVLGACNMTLEDTPANGEIFKLDTKDVINNGYINTFEYEGKKLLTDFAQANACPEGITNVRDDENEIAVLVRGEMAASKSAKWRAFATAPAKDYTVKFAKPDAGDAAGEAQLAKDEKYFASLKKTIVPDSDGKYHKMSEVKFQPNSFKEVGCTAGELAAAADTSGNT